MFRIDDESYSELDLISEQTMHIAPLCAGVIWHNGLVIEADPGCVVMLVRIPGMMEKSILVDSGPVDTDNQIKTFVFNLSNHKIRIMKGQAISRLISLKVG